MMAKTNSTMLPLGTKAPNFNLYDTTSTKKIELSKLSINKGVVIMFICNHCPYVIHLNPALVKVANAYEKKGITFLAISSNDVETYPQDGPLLMKKHAAEAMYPFPYLYDETQNIAKQYKAACTPDFYLFDASLTLQYRGQFDGSRPGNALPVTGASLKDAMDHLIEGKPQSDNQKPSLGCNIKWKAASLMT